VTRIPVPELDGVETEILADDRESIYLEGALLGEIVRETIDWSAFGRGPTHEWRPAGSKGQRAAGDRLHAIRRLPGYQPTRSAPELADDLAGLLNSHYVGDNSWARASESVITFKFSDRAKFRITVEKL